MAEKGLLRSGAIMTFLGAIILTVSTILHPSHADPGDSAAAFAEYATSDSWYAVHLGQFLGTILILGALAVLYQAMDATAQPARVALLTRLALVGVVASATVFAIVQAVDGVTLKFVVDRWAAAAAADKATAFNLAQAVRWTEIGLNSYFRVLVGLTLGLNGLALVLGAGFPRWARWFAAAGVVVGVGQIVDAVGVGYNGFSIPDSPPGFWTAVSLLVGPLFLLWVLVLGVFLWRQASYGAAVQRAEIRGAAQPAQ